MFLLDTNILPKIRKISQGKLPPRWRALPPAVCKMY